MENKKPDFEAPSSHDAAVETAHEADPVIQLAAVTAERDQLAQEKAELYDRLLRKQAEFDNFRRRSEKERSEILEYAAMGAMEALLPVVDDFERALKTETADADYAKGMELIYQSLLDVARRLGVEPIIAVGAKFDPHVHEAIEMVQTDEAEDHTVLEEYRKGYNFRGRLLRPAMVKVAVRP